MAERENLVLFRCDRVSGSKSFENYNSKWGMEGGRLQAVFILLQILINNIYQYKT